MPSKDIGDILKLIVMGTLGSSDPLEQIGIAHLYMLTTICMTMLRTEYNLYQDYDNHADTDDDADSSGNARDYADDDDDYDDECDDDEEDANYDIGNDNDADHP